MSATLHLLLKLKWIWEKIKREREKKEEKREKKEKEKTILPVAYLVDCGYSLCFIILRIFGLETSFVSTTVCALSFARWGFRKCI